MTTAPTTLTSPAPAGLDHDNPWPGLASFTEQEAAFFHGRDGEIAELLEIVRTASLAVLFGKSGLGKSSLLRAGLFPRLRREDFLPVAIRIDYGDAAPPPPEQVRLALQEACAEGDVEAPPPRPGESLWEYFHRKDVDFWNRRNRLVTPVLVFDQFEELFTLGRSSDAARQRGALLLDDLSGLVENRPPAALKRLWDSGEADPSAFDFTRDGCKVLLALREDFLADLEGLRPMFRSILLNRMRVQAMSGTAAAEVVDNAGGHLVEPGVTRRIVQFVAASAVSVDEPADAVAADGRSAAVRVEPALLSVVCSELNARRRENGLTKITMELVAESRQGILNDFYERGVCDLPPAARRFVEERLLTRSGYRNNVALEDAISSEGQEPQAFTREWLDQLVSRRLLRIEERLGLQQIELTHDILTGPVRASRDARRQREAVAAAEIKARQAAAVRRRRRARIAVSLTLLAVCIATVALLVTWHDRRRRAAELKEESRRARLHLDELPPISGVADPTSLSGTVGGKTITFSVGSHPQFGRDLVHFGSNGIGMVNPTPLLFSHKDHVAMDDIKPAAGESMNCTVCHEPRVTGPGSEITLHPVNFDKHCAACHAMEVVPGTRTPIRHLSMDMLRPILDGYADAEGHFLHMLRAMSPQQRQAALVEKKESFGPPPLRKKTTVTTELTPEEWAARQALIYWVSIKKWYLDDSNQLPGLDAVKASLQASADVPADFKTLQTLEFYVLHARDTNDNRCGACHKLSDDHEAVKWLHENAGSPMATDVVAAYRSPRLPVSSVMPASSGAPTGLIPDASSVDILPTGLTTNPRWFTHAAFSHNAHRTSGCITCHAQAVSSDQMSDVLLPGIESCVSCHNEGGTASAACGTCHNVQPAIGSAATQ